MRSAEVVGDSLVGQNAAGARVAIATAQIDRIETRRISTRRSAAIGAGTGVALGAAAVVSTSLLVLELFLSVIAG